MKLDLQAKYLQYLSQKKQDQGFTLIELLVVIIIIGILSAIALPSFLNQANKAKQSEAKQYVGSMNRAQQAQFLEKNYFPSRDVFAELGLGIATQTANYKYDIAGGATSSTPASYSAATNQAQPINAVLKAYIGGVNVGQTALSESTTLAVLCEAKQAKTLSGAADGTENATYNPAGPECPSTKYNNLGAQK